MSEYPFQRSDDEWRGILSEEEYLILRAKGTERPWTGEYVDTETSGTYVCRGCGQELFSSNTKFHSGCGWPSFYEAIDKSKVEEHLDTSHGMRRVEVVCSNCGSHLGHVFPDAPEQPTGLRYCINSVSLRLNPGAENLAPSSQAELNTATSSPPSRPRPTGG